MSHGFALAIVALLAIGLIYRGELFPGDDGLSAVGTRESKSKSKSRSKSKRGSRSRKAMGAREE